MAATTSGAAVTRVYTTLRMQIVDGLIAPGARINIEAVTRELGVSQTPVREALQRLEGDDLVVYTPGRGYRTTPMLDLHGLRSVFEFRLLVEPWAAAAAGGDTADNPAGELEREMRSFERVVERQREVRKRMLAHDTSFHDIILAATKNPVVRRAYRQTHCHLHVFRLLPVDVDGILTVREHRAIVRAIRSRDQDAARQAMAEHIRNSFQRSAQAFQPQPQSESQLQPQSLSESRPVPRLQALPQPLDAGRLG
jgi:DNA-binding GntR family transcriptional regulator